MLYKYSVVKILLLSSSAQLPLFLGAYRASLSKSDRTLLRIIYQHDFTFENGVPLQVLFVMMIKLANDVQAELSYKDKALAKAYKTDLLKSVFLLRKENVF